MPISDGVGSASSIFTSGTCSGRQPWSGFLAPLGLEAVGFPLGHSVASIRLASIQAFHECFMLAVSVESSSPIRV